MGEQYNFAGQLNFGYKISKNWSVAAGLRLNYISNYYDGSLKNIQLQYGGNMLPAAQVLSGVISQLTGGMVVSLVEKAQEQYDEKQARELKKKLAKNQFSLMDFYNQIQQIKKMGNIKDLASMIPGVGKAIKDVDIDNSAFKSVEAIIMSMTPYEREHPEVINGSRRKRIADGSGTSIPEVNRLLKQFEGTRKLMKGAMDGSLASKLRRR